MFGNVFQQVQSAEEEVLSWEAVMDIDPSPTNREALHEANAKFNRL